MSWLPKISSYWEKLRSSLWFLPSLLIISAIILALALIEVDTHFDTIELGRQWPRLFGAGAAGARSMLMAIASSMITVAGVAFSITIVALALASSQYTSRILRNFMRDRANQIVLGVLTGVFTYCLVVLRTIRGGDEGEFVPAVAVLVAVLLALGGIGCFIYFIHHIASSIQAERIIKSAADETIAAIDRLFPSKMGRAADVVEKIHLPNADEWQTLVSPRTGYIQGIDGDGLLRFAKEQSTVLRMERGIGEFIVEGSPLVAVTAQSLSDDKAASLVSLFEIGSQRTMVQDAGFGIRQIVDVALKALSPGINDSTTAVTCVNYLGAILARLAGRSIDAPYRMDQNALRVIARGSTFLNYIEKAFDQIRQSADGNVAVLRSLLQALEIVAARTTDAERHKVLHQQANLIASTARRSIKTLSDLEGIEGDIVRFSQIFEPLNRKLESKDSTSGVRSSS